MLYLDISPSDVIGSRSRLKIGGRKACGFDSHLGHRYGKICHMTTNPHSAAKAQLEQEIHHLESELHSIEPKARDAQREYVKDKESVLEDEAEIRQIEMKLAQIKGDLERKKAEKVVVERLERDADKK